MRKTKNQVQFISIVYAWFLFELLKHFSVCLVHEFPEKLMENGNVNLEAF